MNGVGNIIWDKFLFGIFGTLTDLELTRDGGCVISGYSNSVGAAYYQFIKLNSIGEVEWERDLIQLYIHS